MTESYRTNQFYNFKKETKKGNTVAGPGGRNVSGIFGNNPTNEKFDFPGPTRYHLSEDGKMKKVKIQRGFIRLLTPTKFPLPNYRFFFQFNPQTIVRDVEMSQSINNPLLQTAEELSQPITGNTGFSFTMIVDRSFEMNREQKPNSNTEAKDILAREYPDNIGVLSDIRILDTIVGQGLTEAFDKFVAYQQEIRFNEELATNGSTNGNDVFDAGKFIDSYNANIGNQAFLIPNPVRVVFSSLFMVDGYVTQMKVDYIRFNTDMVPITARIDVQMYALYIGFAKPKTVLNRAINQANPENNSSTPTSVVGNDTWDAARKVVVNNLNKVFVSLNYDQLPFSMRPSIPYIGVSDQRFALTHWMISDNMYLSYVDDVNSAIKRPTTWLGTSYPNVKDTKYTGGRNFDADRYRKKKDEDEVYQALITGIISKITIDELELTVTRKATNPDEIAALGADADIVIYKVRPNNKIVDTTQNRNTGDPSTEPYERWWKTTTSGEIGSDGHGARSELVTNTSGGSSSSKKVTDDRLGILPGLWDQFKRDGQNGLSKGKVTIKATAKMSIEVPLVGASAGSPSTLNFTLDLRGSRKALAVDDQIYVVMGFDPNQVPQNRPTTPTGLVVIPSEALMGDAPVDDLVAQSRAGLPTASAPAASGASTGTGGVYLKFDYPSTTWASPPIYNPPTTVPPPFTWSNIQKVVLHYPGGGSVPSGSDPTAVKQYLNNQHNGYLRDRGYSLGYNAAVDKYGNTYGIRQDKYKCAANLNHNDTSFAILMLVNGAEAATAAQIAAAKGLIRQCNRYASKYLPVTYHSAIGATACPGDGIRNQVNSGTFQV
jgi:hypothetical protein